MGAALQGVALRGVALWGESALGENFSDDWMRRRRPWKLLRDGAAEFGVGGGKDIVGDLTDSLNVDSLNALAG